MATENGYIKVFRQIEQWEWYNDANTFRVFVHLMLNANYRETRYQGREIPPGSYATTYQKIAEKLGISWSQARTAIDHLKSTSEIAVNIAPKFIVVGVQNWAKYQGDELDERTQKRTQERTQIAPKSEKHRTQIAPSYEEEGKEIRIQEEVLKSTLVGDCEKLALEWNELMKAKSIPQVRLPLSQTRKSHIENRIASHGIDGFREMMSKVAVSDFCNGSSKGWLASFDWCIIPANFAKIIEGNYDNKQTAKPSVINGKPDAKIDWLPDYMKSIEGGNRA